MQGLKQVLTLTEDGLKRVNIKIIGDKIAALTDEDSFEGLSLPDDLVVVPGFIDTHIHGVAGYDVMDGTFEAHRVMSYELAKEGTTSYLATTITQSKDNIKQALQQVNHYMSNDPRVGAEILGVHLEGPFLNVDKCGAQPPEYIIEPDLDLYQQFIYASGQTIRQVTIAPEFEGALDLISYSHEHGILPSLGHTNATYEQTMQAYEHGATSLTHFYNAMSGLHHREVGVVGAAFVENEFNMELIADGLHVHPSAIQTLFQMVSHKNVRLITDSMRAKGLLEGEYELAGQKVIVKNGEARLENGALASSTLKMNDAVKNMMNYLNLSLEEAVSLASKNPAQHLGIFDRKGSIAVGKDADLVVLDKDLNVYMTICRGKIVYHRA